MRERKQSSSSRLHPAVLFTAAALLASVAPATSLAGDIEVRLQHRYTPEQRPPGLLLQTGKALSGAVLELTRPDGVTTKLTSEGIIAGGEHLFELEAPVGVTRFVGELTVIFEGGAVGRMPLDLQVEVLGSLTIDVPEERLKVQEGILELTLSRPAGRCEYTVDIDDAAPRQGVVSFAGEPAGTWLRISWQPYTPDDVVLRIRLLCFDSAGASVETVLDPWWLEVPHDEVVFDTGSAVVAAAEMSKISRSYSDIATAISHYGKAYQIKLFILGYTDTVGDPEYNKELSLARAKAIAVELRRLGTRVPLFFAGHGETHLAVLTADEVPEPRNRRARYILAMQEPEPAPWQKLP